MSDKNVGKALLQLDAAALAASPDARQQVSQVLARDRRRVKILTVAAILIWVVAVVLVLGVLVLFGLLFPFQAKLNNPVPDPRFTPEEYRQMREQATITFMMGTLLIALSVVVLSAAALCTLLLVFASRQATLRQVNASLLDVCEQVKQLRAALASGAPPP